MRYAKIRELDISNGEGVGISLFVQGCHFHCKGCFNPETWDFNIGKEWTKDIEDEFIKLAGKPYVQRISILGGEPLADENVTTVLSIIHKIKQLYPDKKIWVYTGYLWENIVDEYYSDITSSSIPITRLMTILSADMVIDGKFEIEKQDLYNEKIIWAGSTNQRIIDVKKEIRKIRNIEVN